MQKKTVQTMQERLDGLRFVKGYNEKFEPIFVKNEGFLQREQRSEMQLKIDHVNEIQAQIEILKQKQEELKTSFYREYNHHFSLSVLD
jgi:hypothetical protein